MDFDPITPQFHLAVPVDDLAAAEQFYGGLLGLPRGRSTDTWIDWNFGSHQFVTHLVRRQHQRASNPVDGYDVPVPHFGLLLRHDEFHRLAKRLRGAGVRFAIDPYVRFEAEPGEQWTMFLFDPAGNALEFKSFANESQIFAV